MEFGTHFFPTLAHSSLYFKSVKGMLDCVDANITVTDPAVQKKVCAKEFKAMRLAAFNDELLYHNINKSHFQHQLSYKMGVDPN